MKQANVLFNEKRALEVFTILCNAWKEQVWIFENVVLPEDQFINLEGMKNLDPVMHAHWLFIAALPQRGGVMAEDPFAPLWHLFINYPGLFDPNTVVKEWDQAKIIEAIQSVAPMVTKGDATGERQAGAMGYKLDQHADAWYNNCRMISERFDGNILNLFKAVEHFPVEDRFEAAFALIDNHKAKVDGIIGMRRKIFSLFIIWLQKDKLVEDFPCPIPVDFHALRVLLATEVIRFRKTPRIKKGTKHLDALVGKGRKRIEERDIDEVAKWINPFLHKHGLSHMDLNPALWVLSRELCAQHPQNSSYKGNAKYLFPKDIIAGTKKLGINLRQTLCSVCLVEEYCSWTVPSRPYYTAGSLVKIERVKTIPSLPVTNLFGSASDLHEFRGHKYSRSKKQDESQFTTKNYSLPPQSKIEDDGDEQNQLSLFNISASNN